MEKAFFAGRWLPSIDRKSKLSSYGAYYVSSSNKELAALEAKYQTRKFFDDIENAQYLKDAEQEYIAEAKKAFPDIELTIDNIVKELHKLIKANYDKLCSIQATWDNLVVVSSEVCQKLGYTDNEIYQKLNEDINKFANAELAWEKYQSKENIGFLLFSWLPPIKQKRNLAAKVYLRENSFDWLIDEVFSYTEISEKISNKLAELKKLDAALNEWKCAISAFNLDYTSATLETVDEICDKTIRFELFRLTTHYWEGRWLMEMKPIEDLKKQNAKIAVKKRWKRRMMITPCVVSTFSMLPSYFKTSDEDYLYNFGDLLIVDEAGQASPEVQEPHFLYLKKHW